MSYQGNLTEDQILDFTFTTRATTGIPTILTGTPSLAIYKDNGDTQSALGITLTANFDSVAGLNHVRVDTSADAFYAVGSNYSVVIAAGTVDSVSVVGETVGTFSIEFRFQEVDVTKISGDSVAADNLELQYDTTGLSGDTFPATQAQVGNLSTGSAAISTVAASTEATTPAVVGTPTNDYTATIQEDGTYHSWAPDGGALEFAYNFNIGANASPVELSWVGYCQSNNDSIGVFARNWVGVSWDQVGTIDGTISTAQQSRQFSLTTSHVNTGANAGDVRLRFYSTGASVVTAFATDRTLLSYTITNQSVGYANGSIWVNTNESNTNTVAFVDGVADNPVSTWAAALTLSASTGIDNFQIANGSTITLTAAITSYTIVGEKWTLALGGQDISNAYIKGASVSGVATGSGQKFNNCRIGTATIPSGGFEACGFGLGGGAFTSGSAGQYIMYQCFSMVPGSGSPSFDFSGEGSTTGINNRGWLGGSTYTLDSDCTLSHEVLAGGGTTITTGGANVEIRGITRSVTLTLSGAGTVQFVGTTGPITISGTATTAVNLYGVSSSLADTSVNTTVTDSTVSTADIAAIPTTVPDAAGTAAKLHSTTDGLINGLNDFDGTGATLHSDYDAAKTAAQAGDAMNLAADAVDAAALKADATAEIVAALLAGAADGSVTVATALTRLLAKQWNSATVASSVATLKNSAGETIGTQTFDGDGNRTTVNS